MVFLSASQTRIGLAGEEIPDFQIWMKLNLEFKNLKILKDGFEKLTSEIPKLDRPLTDRTGPVKGFHVNFPLCEIWKLISLINSIVLA